MTEILEVSKKHFIDFKRNYLIFIIVSVVLIGLNYIFLQKNHSDLIYTALYAIIAIPIFGIIIINKSTYLSKAIDITQNKLRMAAMIVYPPIPIVLITLAYYQIRMQNWNVGDNEALYYALVSSFVGFLALLIVLFVFLELKRWMPNWPKLFGKTLILSLYILVILVYPIFFSGPYSPPYYMEISIVMLILFISHITTYIIMAYSRMEY